MLFKRLDDMDCPYFVELYNRYPNKSITLTKSIIKKIITKNKSYRTVGKFMVTDNLEHLKNSDGLLLS